MQDYQTLTMPRPKAEIFIGPSRLCIGHLGQGAFKYVAAGNVIKVFVDAYGVAGSLARISGTILRKLELKIT